MQEPLTGVNWRLWEGLLRGEGAESFAPGVEIADAAKHQSPAKTKLCGKVLTCHLLSQEM